MTKMTAHNAPTILYEDNHLLAIDKPADLVTQGAQEADRSVLVWGKDYLKRRYGKPGNVYLGVVSRLDAKVTGVLLLARTSKAAGRLNQQFRQRTVRKVYWALVQRDGLPREGRLEHYVWHDDARQKVVCVDPNHAHGQVARLGYRVMQDFGPLSLLEVELETGRKHQIRVQLAAIGHPILGDQKYGSEQPFPAGIGLHARRLELDHPVQKGPVVLEAPLPSYWPVRWDG